MNTSNKNITKLQRLLASAEAAQLKAESILSAFNSALNEISGIECVTTYLPGDGIGVCAENNNSANSYMSAEQAIAFIEETGTIPIDPPTYL